MTIVVSAPEKATPQNQCAASVAEMIVEAARSNDDISPIRLAIQIVTSVERAMKLSAAKSGIT